MLQFIVEELIFIFLCQECGTICKNAKIQTEYFFLVMFIRADYGILGLGKDGK